MELPREVVQHIFALKEFPTQRDPALTVRDRVRCQAVCRAWREYLSPASWPLQRLTINFKEGTDYGTNEAPAQWTFQTQPAARFLFIEDWDPVPDQSLAQLCSYLSLPHPELRDLNLYFGIKRVRAVWSAVCALPGLTGLYLHDFSERGSVMGGAMLAALPSALALLHVCSWQAAELKWPEPLLVGLTRLVLVDEDRALVDAPLPGLRELVIEATGKVVLAGANLALPRLTRLCVSSDLGAEYGYTGLSSRALDIRFAQCFPDLVYLPPMARLVTLKADFGRMPLLASLAIDCVELEEPSAAAGLPHLTRLAVKCDAELGEAAAVSLLLRAPGMLRSLSVVGCQDVDGVAHALRQMTGLTSLTGDSSSALLPLLGSTSALQELELHLQQDSDSAGIGLQLSNLTQLAKLTANRASIIPHLAPLCNLRELCLSHVPPAQLTVEQLSSLAALPSLQKLHFMRVDISDGMSRCLQVLRGALPACKVTGSWL